MNEPNSKQAYNTRRILANAKKQADQRKLDDYFIVDVDAHHYETESWPDIVQYIEDPVIKHNALSTLKRGFTHGMSAIVPSQLVGQDLGGRISRYQMNKQDEPGIPKEVSLVTQSMEMMGVDRTILFPTPLLALGLQPAVEMEVALARAYAKWLIENVLSKAPFIKTMLLLPFNSPDASLGMIEEFGDHPGVVGFMVTSVRYKPVHDNVYMKVYRALEERGKPIGFHGGYIWQGERIMEQFNKFISVHTLGFPLYNMIHLINLVVNGIPERFPNLKIIWIESGLAWIPFMMKRLDHEYAMRTSEVPSLTKKPSEYMQDFYYTSQPLESLDDLEYLEIVFDRIKAETQLLYSSDWPHWDFDLPRVIYDLPFLSENAKRNILGENARKLFRL